MPKELEERIRSFHEDYLQTPAGQKHLAITEAEPEEVRGVLAEIKEKRRTGQDVTDDVLRRLLPHTDSEFHSQGGYRISTWPCIRKDVRGWFEGAGWKKPEDWTPTATLLFEAIDGLVAGDLEPWQRFLNSEYRLGFGTGFVSPILFCLDERFPVINSKVVKTYAYCTEQLGSTDEINARLEHYLQNAKKVLALQKRLAPLGLENIREWDIFCHYMVSKRLGGGDETQVVDEGYATWLFVANPEIFQWEQAFAENGVEWTGSRGSYAQKLLRQGVRAGHRAFGYQAGPNYEIRCELRVADAPYQTSEGTWAVHLVPVRWLSEPITLSAIKAHPVLSALHFVRQPQASISGITQEQLVALESLASGPPVVVVQLSPLDKLCKELRAAHIDTSQPGTYEALLAKLFCNLGFEVELLGGAGKPDVLVTGRLGSATYSAVIEAKTCREGGVVDIGRVNYGSIRDHREEHAADYALLVAPAFSGGKVVEHAVRDKVGMLTTEALISVLRRHDQFPFSLTELRRLFETPGLSDGVAAELGRIHGQHESLLHLVATILHIFDSLQRQRDVSDPIAGSAIHLYLLGHAAQEGIAPPDRRQIDHILALLSNPVLEILVQADGGYLLTLAPEEARKRMAALTSLLSGESL